MNAGVLEQMAVFADPAWRADLGQLSESARIAVRSYAADAFLLSDLARRVPAPGGTQDSALAWQSFVREVALARGLQERAAAREIDIAVLLARHLPRTVERMSCGSILLPRAVAFAEELVGVDLQVAWAVDRDLADRIATMAPQRIRQEVRRAVDRLDADAAADRAAKAAAGRAVRVSAGRDGQATAFLNGPAVPMTRWSSALTETAQALRSAGDPRGLDALRFDLVMGGFALDEPPAAAATSTDVVSAAHPTPGEHETDADVPEALRPRAGLPPLPRPPTTPDPEQLPLEPPSTLLTGVPTPEPDPEQPEPGHPEPHHPGLDQPGPTPEPLELLAARAEAARLLEQARGQVERLLQAAHAAEAESLHRTAQARAEHDRLCSLVLRERLTTSARTPEDRRLSRPVQLLVHVPVTTALGLGDEPGWLDGYGWVSAPECRQLLPVAELRQVCVSTAGQVVDLAPAVVRPEPTPTGAREALLRMATGQVALTSAGWRVTDQHDPSAATAELVRVRDRFCDGPLGALDPARTSDLDHAVAHPDGPTAAWNLAARARRTHRFEHAGWVPVRTADSTLWTSPAGQVAVTPSHQYPPPPLDPDAELPDPDALHALERRLTSTDGLSD